MLNYLLAYGVSQNAERFEEIDITDKMKLEDQINVARKSYYDLLKLMDDIDGKLLDVKRRISFKSKDVIQEAKIESVRPNELYSTDEEYLTMEYERDALMAGKDMVSKQINFLQMDLKIMQSTFYNKF